MLDWGEYFYFFPNLRNSTQNMTLILGQNPLENSSTPLGAVEIDKIASIHWFSGAAAGPRHMVHSALR